MEYSLRPALGALEAADVDRRRRAEHGLLDLTYDEYSKFYEAPLQMKANGGMFLIDDFGRQQMRPRELLNRWIVPLEKRHDYLTLHTGKKIEVPFDQLIIFSTNLDPKQLVDEAFLRRIRYKVEVGNPDPAGVPRDHAPYLHGPQRALQRRRAALPAGARVPQAQPRDARLPPARPDRPADRHRALHAHQPTMSRELLAAACKSYFVEV